jgi:serine/threonine protein kinase
MQPSPSLPLDGTSNQTDDSVQALCERWRRGEAPLADLLARAGELAPLDLVEALAADADERWRQGDRVSVNDYLARYPQVAADPAAACELIYCEFRLRLDRGEAVELSEYLDRFPDLAARLRRKDVQQASYLPGRTTFLRPPLEESSSAPSPTSPPSDAIPSTPGPEDAASAPPVRLPGVPDYELHLHIGAGGFGHVWLARNRHDQGLCAVKVVSKGYRVELDGLRVYRQCAGNHPGLVEIKHVGEGEGFYYYVMPLADDVTTGPVTGSPATYEAMTLRRCLAQRTLGLEEILAIARSLLAALAHLQERGVSHCDVKPDNILLVGRQWQLGDLGLATQTERIRPGRGTVAFWPPEGPRDHTADLYALGKTLYLMLTGAGLERFEEFAAGTLKAPSGRRCEPLRQIILRACQADPGKRFTSSVAMRRDLDQYYPEGKRRRRRWLIGAVVALALAANIGVGAFWLLERGKPVGNPPVSNPDLERKGSSLEDQSPPPRLVEKLSKKSSDRINEISSGGALDPRNGRFVEMLKGNKEILKIYSEELGPASVYAVETNDKVERLKRLVMLPDQVQRELARSYSQDDEVHRYFDEGRLAEAIALHRQILALRAKHFVKNDIELARTKHYLAYLLLKTKVKNDEREAERLLQEQVPTYQGKFGESNPELATVYNKLAEVYERRQAYDQAEHMLDLARKIRRDQLEAGHELRIYSALRLAMLLDEQGRSTEAGAYYQEAREQADQYPIAKRDLSQLFEEWANLIKNRKNRPEEAAFYRLKAAEIRKWWRPE